MNVLLCRIDERLIHGQVMTRWITGLFITNIILVDDDIARDEFMQDVLSLSAPVGVKVAARTVEDAAHVLASDTSDEKTLLLFKDIRSVKALCDAGYKVERLNIGNVGSSPIRNKVTREVFLSDAEIEIAKDLGANGTYIYIQKLPTDKEVDIQTRF